ncbi:hypothetical protein HBA54_03190 [Pelagibius litoralis]|uniref:Uncharacterized protein n=1 Tax=Pelagibius litoralis TaxID=374515 RepID=A0A967C6Q0_9PROT|nr:hypothetical protein [Pelagibius litoralis]NIA67587.1 hypothetical protein [Pelagibius litoralis]
MSENLGIPHFLGGDEDPWRRFSPEGEEDVKRQNQEQLEARQQVILLVARVFDTPEGRELREIMADMMRSNARVKPGMRLDAITAVLLWNDAQRSMLEWIDRQVEKAREF